MYSSKADSDPRRSKWERALKRARNVRPDEQSLEPGEHHQRAIRIIKRRLALSIDDTGTQINGYFDRD